MAKEVIVDDAIDTAIEGMINFIDDEFEIQETLLDVIPANEQIRDVVVLTVAKAVDKILEAKEIEGMRGISSMRGGISVVIEDDAEISGFEPYPAITPDMNKMGDTLAYIVQEIADIYDLDTKEIAEAIDNTEIKIPVGYGNNELDNKSVTDYVIDMC